MKKLSEELSQRGEEVYELHAQHINPQFVKVLKAIHFDRAFVRGEGQYLYDKDGNQTLDLLGGYGVFNVGRNHPKIKTALKQALDLDLPNLVKMDCALLSGFLAEELVKRTPEALDRVFFANSGAETVEAAIKFARATTGKPGLLSWDNAFHGLTMGALSLTGCASFRDRFGPYLGGARSIPFDDLAALEHELKKGDVAALFCEPIQGKGVHLPSPGFFKKAKALLEKYGALLVMDEVQTGLGRTGKFLAIEHEDVVPDIVTVAKALSGGMIPVGAVLMTKKVHSATFDRMDRCIVHGSTFYQNDLAMAAGLATLEVLDEENLVENADKMGELLRSKLRALKEKHPVILEVRGRGLMIAIEFKAPDGFFNKMKWAVLDKLEKGLFTQVVIMTLLDKHRILSQVAGHKMDVLKFLPPLTLNESDVDRIVDALDQTLNASNVGAGMLEMGLNLGKHAIAGR